MGPNPLATRGSALPIGFCVVRRAGFGRQAQNVPVNFVFSLPSPKPLIDRPWIPGGAPESSIRMMRSNYDKE